MYAVIEWGGGGGGLCPSCKIHRGGLCPSCKIHGGDFVHVYKNEQGGFCPGGILSYTLKMGFRILVTLIILFSIKVDLQIQLFPH